MWRATAPRAIEATPRSVRAKRAARATIDGPAGAGGACVIDVMPAGSHPRVGGTAGLTGVPGCGRPYASIPPRVSAEAATSSRPLLGIGDVAPPGVLGADLRRRG